MTNVMQRAYVRVGQLRDRARLAVESLAKLRVCCERRRKNLDRNGAIEAGINCSVDLSHPARAGDGLNCVRSEPKALCQCHR
jgi:hypothetical protein